MSNMFTNYNNIDPSYVPNNMHLVNKTVKSYTKLAPVALSKPYELYNAKNELEGYFWYHGESITLDFSIEGEITLENDALIYSNKGEYPTNLTEGYIGQKAYNTADYSCWECVAVEENDYMWVPNGTVKYDPDLTRSVYIDAKDYLKDKMVDFKIFDFRMNENYLKTIKGTESARFEISPDLSKKMLPGIYSCSLSVYNDEMNQKIFGNDSCKLLVK